ncbi:uncharacterized protein LOC109712920 isoform X2 [Ananas comosus]|uniref:Uncharacterized protein LOC109712920 isoform X2 n=1 Tax=Ananas comosus TaxID=4615 RepID=A0A6P5F9M3_ANACO|nr:uncharacterized protein LOC109712920 isoform X2 [Ananas comosus]
MSLFFTLISYIFVVFSPLFFLFLGVGSNSFMGDDDRELKHEAVARAADFACTLMQISFLFRAQNSTTQFRFQVAEFYRNRAYLLLLSWKLTSTSLEAVFYY